MRRISVVRDFLSRFLRGSSVLITLAAPLFLMIPGASAAAEKAPAKIEVFPSVPYYAFIIYENLAVFWVGILGLLVIIRMKLREIERTQKLGIDTQDENAPLLQ
jgi:hypothetical protein